MIRLSVPDMNCGHCKASVEAALKPIAQSVAVDLALREVAVEGADAGAVVAALDEAGFPATVRA
ncbi:cation transporter [Pseudomonas sp. GX19020]|uniref:heavy-metal-associated domain-containing protein n=1 Tax=Pseudomonas sp. GX19020 TaxID=2942277 RepID=UPI00201A1A9F|nr:cation transporter [Pseudomonas sp. GX19020]MCL4065458.1 cation transporter [Pseudomonas sp. GX19020]